MTKPIDPKFRAEFAAQAKDLSTKHSCLALGLDFDELREEMRDMDLTEDQACELLQTYINVAVQFSLMGFGQHPVQLAKGDDEPQEMSKVYGDFLASSSDDMVQLEYDPEGTNSEELEPEGGAP